MSWREHILEYINVAIIKTLSQHASGAVFAILCFALSGWLSERFLPDGMVRGIVRGIEKTGILLVLIFLFVEMLWHLIGKGIWEAWARALWNSWRRRRKVKKGKK